MIHCVSPRHEKKLEKKYEKPVIKVVFFQADVVVSIDLEKGNKKFLKW